jgi:hypothetical protein
LSEAYNDEGVLTKKPKDLIKTDTDIIAFIDTTDAKGNNERLSSHQTPSCAEMRYELDIEDDFDNSEDYLNPTFYYRSYSFFKEYDNGAYPIPIWVKGTVGGNGFMSSKVILDYDGLKLDNDEPEVFACPYSAIYNTVDGNTYNTTVKDNGVMRTEWNLEEAGASLFDYTRKKPEWSSIGHWGRMVFSFGAYSAQRLTFAYGNPDSRNKLTIDDDSYKLIITRPGFAYGVDSDSLLMTNGYNTVFRNDLPKMAERMTLLWDYYSKPKKAVKITTALFDASGNTNVTNTTVGTFLTDINIDGKKITINSIIKSVEYDLNGSSPRVIIQTEYPDSPQKSREKQLKTPHRVRKFK